MSTTTPPVWLPVARAGNGGATMVGVELLDDLRSRFAAIDGVVELPSQFGHDEAWWARGKEVAHLEGKRMVEIRVTRAVISARRAELKAHPSVHLRRGTSDWLEVVLSSPADVDLAVDLFEAAAGAIAGSQAPPTTAEIERRRKLH